MFYVFAKDNCQDMWEFYGASPYLDNCKNNINILTGYDAYHFLYEGFSVWEAQEEIIWKKYNTNELKQLAKEVKHYAFI